MNLIEVTQLKKSFGPVEAVKSVSFTVKQGQLFSFLGPNGAGKSTTIDMLCTLLPPDGGRATIGGRVLGQDDQKIRRDIGIVFQDGLLDPLLTVGENLDLRAGFYYPNSKQRKEAVGRTVGIVGLQELLHRPYGKLSGGQRRRTDIARALVQMPRLLFLDEPTTGLDPQTRSLVWDTIGKLQREEGTTIFLTTHYMEEAERSDAVVVIDHGMVVAQGSPVQLKAAYAKDLLWLDGDLEQIQNALVGNGHPFSERGGRIAVTLSTSLDALPILELCRPHIKSFEVHSGTMDDVFMGITGRELREQ